MSDPRRPSSRDLYELAVICALSIEYEAVVALFDIDWEEHESYNKAPNDQNEYSTGRIGQRDVVVAMPGIGKANSARSAATMYMSFPNIKLGLVVGICGGMPFGSDKHGEDDIFLGDIIIGTLSKQHDLGKQLTTGYVPKEGTEDVLGRPKPEISSFLEKMRLIPNRKRLETQTSGYLANLFQKQEYLQVNFTYPGSEKDILYKSDYVHKHHDQLDCAECHKDGQVCGAALKATCSELKCSVKSEVVRVRSEPGQEGNNNSEQPPPQLHFGYVASGDTVMKSGLHRDILASLHKIIAIEMESAGMWDSLPTVVIKGVCDYADSHKNDQFHKYAAASAACCMKAFLNQWRLTDKSWQPAAVSSKDAPFWENLSSQSTRYDLTVAANNWRTEPNSDPQNYALESPEVETPGETVAGPRFECNTNINEQRYIELPQARDKRARTSDTTGERDQSNSAE